jgi:hypothetical protein
MRPLWSGIIAKCPIACAANHTRCPIACAYLSLLFDGFAEMELTERDRETQGPMRAERAIDRERERERGRDVGR